MSYQLQEWLNLALRWFHVVAAIFWIGQTALFTWLDTRMRVERQPDGTERVWMVHSGGFYRVDKIAVPEQIPRLLHWFRWEAALTWLSGLALLTVVYYHGGLMVEQGSATSVWLASGIGVATLILGWVVYDFLWISPLAKREGLATAISVALLVAIAWGLTEVLPGRAAYIHVGALMGTIMTANVWLRILPGQRKMIAAIEAGRPPDLTLALRAKQRSRHNTFMALPVIFIMISSHFPTASYGHRLNWLMLAFFLAVGFFARWLLNRWESRPSGTG